MAKFSTRLQAVSRQRKLEMLVDAFKPKPEYKVLAVGVDSSERHQFSNFVEYNYPYPDSVTGLTMDPPERWSPDAPIKLVQGDGRELPFADDSFDIAVSNAVIEHVGTREQQKQFTSEMCRVAPNVFITTPNFYFPFELHTRLPFVQFMPGRLRNGLLYRTGNQYYADGWGSALNLLKAGELKRMFSKDYDVKVMGLRVTLMAESLIVIARRKGA